MIKYAMNSSPAPLKGKLTIFQTEKRAFSLLKIFILSNTSFNFNPPLSFSSLHSWDIFKNGYWKIIVLVFY